MRITTSLSLAFIAINLALASPVALAGHGHGHGHHAHHHDGGGWFGGLLRRIGVTLDRPRAMHSRAVATHTGSRSDVAVEGPTALDSRRSAEVDSYLREHAAPNP